ncbi:MAG TPA: DUF3626 domain-containing protein [Gemmatimonadaceae bacterium]
MSEHTEALSRLAARDAASLAAMGIDATSDADKIAAMSRIISDLHTPIMQARFVYARLIKHLQQSELTINFKAFKFFNKKPENEKYVSQFEGGNTWGDPTYMDMRDQTEEALFDYSGTRAVTSKAAPVQQRVQQLGQRGGTDFEGAVRPKYAALNYARLKYGSAAQWGKSYMVLKEYVKHGATYVHTDSFDLAGSARQRALLTGQVANFLHMQRLIVNMSPSMLTALDSASRGVSFGEAVQPPGIGDTCYVEAHVHSEIRFERDIQKLVINQGEVDDCETQTQKLHTNDKKRWKVLTSKKLIERFEKFAEKYRIAVEFS